MLRLITTLLALVLILLLVVGLVAQPQISDWPDFWSNLTVEALGGLVFGVIFMAVLDFQRRSFETRRTVSVSKQSKCRYLVNIKKEIDDNIIVPRTALQTGFKEEQEGGRSDEEIIQEVCGEFGQDVTSNDMDTLRVMLRHTPYVEMQSENLRMLSKTTYWDALMPSGLLPSLLDESMLGKIADFYHALRVIDKSEELIREYLIKQDAEHAMRGYNHNMLRFSPFEVTRIRKLCYEPAVFMIVVKGTQLSQELGREIRRLR